jgi:uncharacterized repeat protein (TIGR04002 family)
MILYKQILKLSFSALFAAAVFCCTYLIIIPIPGAAGYINGGDAVIYICASLLPTPYAVSAAVIGASFSDILFAPIWLPATIIIKSATAFAFTSKGAKILNLRNISAFLLSIIFCAGGYYLYEALVVTGFKAALISVPFNIIQAVFSSVVFMVFACIADKSKIIKTFKEKIQ